jgi:hypothetical protein
VYGLDHVFSPPIRDTHRMTPLLGLHDHEDVILRKRLDNWDDRCVFPENCVAVSGWGLG